LMDVPLIFANDRISHERERTRSGERSTIPPMARRWRTTTIRLASGSSATIALPRSSPPF
jgi:hypothetical protein